MNVDTKLGRLRFQRQFRAEQIDDSERAIEHHKSMIRNHKAAIKELNRQDREIRGENLFRPVPEPETTREFLEMERYGI